jgi:hypothetical protein
MADRFYVLEPEDLVMTARIIAMGVFQGDEGYPRDSRALWLNSPRDGRLLTREELLADEKAVRPWPRSRPVTTPPGARAQVPGSSSLTPPDRR